MSAPTKTFEDFLVEVMSEAYSAVDLNRRQGYLLCILKECHPDLYKYACKKNDTINEKTGTYGSTPILIEFLRKNWNRNFGPKVFAKWARDNANMDSVKHGVKACVERAKGTGCGAGTYYNILGNSFVLAHTPSYNNDVHVYVGTVKLYSKNPDAEEVLSHLDEIDELMGEE